MLNLFKAQSGFSLVQAMIISGVLAGSSLVATRLLTDQKLALKGADTRNQIDQLHSLVYAVLQNKDNCSATIRGLSGGTDQSVSAVSASTANTILTSIRATTQTTTTAAGTTYAAQVVLETNDGSAYNQARTYMNGNVRVRDISWEYPITVAPAPTPINPTPVAPGPGIAYLHVTYDRLKADVNSRLKTGYGAKDIRKTIKIRLQRKTDGSFDGCYAITEDIGAAADGNKDLAKSMCESLNSAGNTTIATSFFTWDETRSTCVPKNHVCNGDGDIFTGINSNGVVQCKKLTDWVDVNLFVDNTTPTPCTAGYKAQLVISGVNKVKILCTPSRCDYNTLTYAGPGCSNITSSTPGVTQPITEANCTGGSSICGGSCVSGSRKMGCVWTP